MYINNNLKFILNHLHKLQEIYIGVIDIEISTRKDMKLTSVTFCSYDYNDVTKQLTNSTELYVHKLEWYKNEVEIQDELNKITKELADIYIKYYK